MNSLINFINTKSKHYEFSQAQSIERTFDLSIKLT